MANDDRGETPWYAPGANRGRQRVPVRGEVVWTLQQGSRTLRCELRDQSSVGAGWDVQALDADEASLLTQRCPDEPSARALADQIRKDFIRDGWNQ